MWNEIRPLRILSIGMVTLIIIVVVVIAVNIIIMIFIASTIFISRRITIGGTQRYFLHCLALGVLFEKCLELGECMSLIQNNVFLPPRFNTILLDSSISIQAH